VCVIIWDQDHYTCEIDCFTLRKLLAMSNRRKKPIKKNAFDTSSEDDDIIVEKPSSRSQRASKRSKEMDDSQSDSDIEIDEVKSTDNKKKTKTNKNKSSSNNKHNSKKSKSKLKAEQEAAALQKQIDYDYDNLVIERVCQYDYTQASIDICKTVMDHYKRAMRWCVYRRDFNNLAFTCKLDNAAINWTFRSNQVSNCILKYISYFNFTLIFGFLGFVCIFLEKMETCHFWQCENIFGKF